MLLKQKHFCWNITPRCNANCGFCHRMNNISELPLEANRKILNDLISSGVRKITWTGGEALLYQGIDELIKISHDNGVRNHLITNGKELTKERLEKLIESLNFITLSLDACLDKLNFQIGRFENQFELVKKILDNLNVLEYSGNIKINTLACSYNLYHIPEMLDFIEKNRIEKWKIFKFVDLRGYSIKNKKEYEISDEQFSLLKHNIACASKCKQILLDKIVFVDGNDLEDDYVLIRADGAVIVTRDKNDRVLGNLLFDNITNIISSNYNLIFR